jgi:hypothetical protein
MLNLLFHHSFPVLFLQDPVPLAKSALADHPNSGREPSLMNPYSWRTPSFRLVPDKFRQKVIDCRDEPLTSTQVAIDSPGPS